MLLGSLAACLVPLSLLFDFRNTFYVDWFNHLWYIEYFGEYLKWHWTPPDVFITSTLVGVPMPLFYSGKFYALAGCLSAWIGSAAAFRAVAAFIMFIQFVHVERAVRCANPSKWLSFTTGLLVSWAIYPLTNLYNRSALTEFVAVALLNAAVSCLFVLLIKLSRGQQSYYDAVAVGLLYTGAAVTHPLTALFGCTFIIVVSIGALLVLRRFWLITVGAVNAILIAIVLAPWCYVMLRFSRSMAINDPSVNKAWFLKDAFFPETIDSFWSRLSPTPVDLRSISKGVETASPYLDAQITIPLVLFGGVLCWFWFKSARQLCQKTRQLLIVIFSLSTGLSLLFFAISVYPAFSAPFHGFFDILQFPYRLTAYVNLALLMAVMALAGLADWGETKDDNRAVSQIKTVGITLCVTISLCALIAKLIHANAVCFADPLADIREFSRVNKLQVRPDSQGNWYPGFFGRGPRLLDLPVTSYGQFFYSVLDGLATARPEGFKKEQSIAFLPGDLSRFGKVNAITIELAVPTLVVTNVQPFPWNVLTVDGVRQAPKNLVTAPSSGFAEWMKAAVVAVPLMPGEHVLRYRFAPKPLWRILNVLSWVFLILWIVAWPTVGVWSSRTNTGSLIYKRER